VPFGERLTVPCETHHLFLARLLVCLTCRWHGVKKSYYQWGCLCESLKEVRLGFSSMFSKLTHFRINLLA